MKSLRSFTSKENARKFAKRAKAEGKQATINEVVWIRQGIKRTEYEVTIEW